MWNRHKCLCDSDQRARHTADASPKKFNSRLVTPTILFPLRLRLRAFGLRGLVGPVRLGAFLVPFRSAVHLLSEVIGGEVCVPLRHGRGLVAEEASDRSQGDVPCVLVSTEGPTLHARAGSFRSHRLAPAN